MEVPRWIIALPVRLRSLVRRARAEKDLDDELSFHLAMQAHAAREAGGPERDAVRRARLDLGGVAQTKDRCRDAWPLRWAADLLHDVRYALRGLRRTPAFTLTAVTVLALGIGANTALFSVFNAVVLSPLPYPNASRLVRIWSAMPTQGYPRSGSAMPDYRVWRSENHTFDEMGASYDVTYNLTGDGQPERLAGARLTASLWRILRPQPVRGALFTPPDDEWGRHRVAVLSEGLWRRRFGADPRIIGRILHLDDQPFTVIGVLPAAFAYPSPRTEIWTPISFAPGDVMDTRDNHFVDVIGRLKPGRTPAEAQADLDVLATQIQKQFPENAGLGVTMTRWQDSIVGDVRPTLTLLLGAVGLVLLIACINVANLVLARAIARQQELTVRVAIGAGRGRLARQLLTENVLLGSIGAVVGGALAYLIIRALPGLGPIGLPRLQEVRFDQVTVALPATLAILTGVGVGVWPLRRLHHVDLANDLKESGRSGDSGARHVRGRRALVIAEVSLSIVLLIGAGLLIVSLIRLQRVDPGFRPDHVYTATVSLPTSRYHSPQRVGFVRQLTDRISGLPGVQAVAVGTGIPMGGTGWGKYFSIDGRPTPASVAQVEAVEYRQITPGYVRALGGTLQRGREFTSDDDAQHPAVAIVNETLARHDWPGHDPIGARVSPNPPESLVPKEEIAAAIAAGELPHNFREFPRLTVVGVVQDLREQGLDQPAGPVLYVPFAQALTPYEVASGSFFLLVRTATNPLSFQSSIQAAVTGIDGNLPVANVRTLEAAVSESLARRRFAMLLLGTLAGVALILVISGIYGVTAYIVNQRQRELGIRLALGATATELTRLVLVQGLGAAVVGVVIGGSLAAALSHVIAAELFDVKPLDPTIYALTAVIMVIVTVAACALPAVRAARLNPSATLRHD